MEHQQICEPQQDSTRSSENNFIREDSVPVTIEDEQGNEVSFDLPFTIIDGSSTSIAAPVGPSNEEKI